MAEPGLAAGTSHPAVWGPYRRERPHSRIGPDVKLVRTTPVWLYAYLAPGPPLTSPLGQSPREPPPTRRVIAAPVVPRKVS